MNSMKDDEFAQDYLQSHFNTSAVVSTLSLRLSLCKIANFAQGGVKHELLSILGYKKTNEIKPSYEDLEELLNTLKSIDFILFNRIFVNYTNEFTKTFLSTEFGVRVDKVGFKYSDTATSFINKLIDGATYKRITDVIETRDIHNETSLIAVNVAYLKVRLPGKSRLICDKRSTLNSDSTTVINMKLASAGASVTIVIPIDMESLKDFLNNLDKPNFFRKIKSRMRFELVDIELPRFKIKTAIEWTDSLKKIGLKTIFLKNTTDLSSVLKETSQDRHVYLSKVKQKNFLQVDEMGVLRQEPQDELKPKPADQRFAMYATADRPFYFSISLHFDRSDYLNVEDLFSGIYFGPE
ncbi:antitrypsin-like [Zerene cesonia]|uniref:antitrypsin-like n=1 Tax=Zerene cesonia TaxID=33412 RepID=UPI0018E57B5E|nr:antitrypsin-like [Zerene cesonia]